MALILRDITFTGPAMPGPFVQYKLEELLLKKKLLAKDGKAEAKEREERFQVYKRRLGRLREAGGNIAVLNQVIAPLVEHLGYATVDASEPVTTREGAESGGYLLKTADGAHLLRAWAVPVGTDLDAPNQRGRAYRFSPAMVAQRVLLTKGERVGILTDGQELRIVLSDPSGRDSNLSIALDRSGGWRSARDVPDSFRLLCALCQPKGVSAIAELLDEARLAQSGVTKKLREQARRSVERFIQGLMDAPENREQRESWKNLDEVAQQLWHEGLILVYRMLFILKLESASDPARSFSFATVSTWRNSFSPSTALASVVEEIRDHGAETGEFLASSLRALFRLFSHGLSSSDLHVSPLGGVLFGKEATPILDSLFWSERAVADLLDALLWTIPDRKGRSKGEASQGRERVHYGTLDVEDLGRVYEALLELEPGVSNEPMCRLRRAKLEVVVPLAQGAPYRKQAASEDEEDSDDTEEDEDEGSKKSKVLFIEEIPAHRFYLRVGLGRKASGSYYTPHAFVRFLVQETLGPQLAERSPQDNPNPLAILNLKVLDPAMGSGHFLVEACRYLGEALYEACRLCDEQALDAQRGAESAKSDEDRVRLTARAFELWKRVEDLPDPNDELVAYLPSRIVDSEESGLSQRKALALCRRLVAVHCLYGVDKNPLAVELARVSLWLESYAEGLPLTFVEHRIVEGDSLTGPNFEHLLTLPHSGKPIEEMQSHGVTERLQALLAKALVHVRELEASIGKDIGDLELKRVAKQNLDEALKPIKLVAAAWTGGVMLGDECDDDTYLSLVLSVASGDDGLAVVESRPVLQKMVALGRDGIPYDLQFPEVFHPDGSVEHRGGFDAVIGNPPWDRMLPADREFFAGFDLRVLDAPTKRERDAATNQLKEREDVRRGLLEYMVRFRYIERTIGRTFRAQDALVDGARTIGKPDAYRAFAERAHGLAGPTGYLGLVLPSGIHANEGATGVRRLLLDESQLKICFSFENSRRIFDIHRSFKFATIVARLGTSTVEPFEVGFYVADVGWLAGARESFTFTSAFIRTASGPYLTFPELRTPRDFSIAAVCYRNANMFGKYAERLGVRVGRELNMADDAYRFTPLVKVSAADPREPAVASELRLRGYIPLHEGKTFHQFTDRWEDPPRYVVALSDIADKPVWTGPARFFRSVFRKIARSTDERTAISAFIPPGTVSSDSVHVERSPECRSNGVALLLLAFANSCAFDWNLRQRCSANVNIFILDGCPVPRFGAAQERFLAHSALRLSCNHAGYKPLWQEQVGDAWREAGSKDSWPVLSGDDARWAVRARIDAVVAQAYGLDRAQYEHVLASFSHSSYKRAPELCLAAFDELVAIGLDAFTKKHDPYWDIPLVTTLPKPVVDLGVAAPAAKAASDAPFTLTAPEPKAKSKRGKR